MDALGPGILTPEQRRQQIAGPQQFAKASADRLMRAARAGVKIAFGSDEYGDTPGRTRGQASLLTLQAYQEAGMQPIDILRAATVNAAALLGWADRRSVERGKLADIIAVQGDPLKDVKDLQRVRAVMKGGDIIRQPSTKD